MRQLEARASTKVVNKVAPAPLKESVEPARKPFSEKPVFVTSSLFRQPSEAKPKLAVKAVPRVNKENDQKFIPKVKVGSQQSLPREVFSL